MIFPSAMKTNAHDIIHHIIFVSHCCENLINFKSVKVQFKFKSINTYVQFVLVKLPSVCFCSFLTSLNPKLTVSCWLSGLWVEWLLATCKTKLVVIPFVQRNRARLKLGIWLQLTPLSKLLFKLKRLTGNLQNKYFYNKNLRVPISLANTNFGRRDRSIVVACFDLYRLLQYYKDNLIITLQTKIHNLK